MPLATETQYRSFADQTLHYFLRDHSAIPEGPIASNACWSGAELRDDVDAWRVELTSSQIEEISEITDKLMASGLPLAQVTRAAFTLPELGKSVRGWANDIANGRGPRNNNGHLHLPETPGLGVHPDEDTLGLPIATYEAPR